MTEVAEVVLFYSKYSKECQPIIQYIMNNRLPVSLIPLDDVESRNKALNGPLLQIQRVPTLVVSYVNNDVQLYVGNQKIIAWFSIMTKPPMQGNSPSQQVVPDHNTSLQESNVPKQKKSKKTVKSPTKTPKKKKTKSVIPQSDPSHHTEIIFDEGPYPTPQHAPNIPNKKTRPSPNEGIMAMAKQMAAERDRHLNYNENGSG